MMVKLSSNDQFCRWTGIDGAVKRNPWYQTKPGTRGEKTLHTDAQLPVGGVYPDPPLPNGETLPLTYHPLPNIACAILRRILFGLARGGPAAIAASDA